MPRYPIKSYRGTESYAFISYAHKDAERIFDEMSRLDSAGFRLYYDQGIDPGQSWQEELAQAIEACSIFVIFLTDNAIASRNCMREINFALDRECEILSVHLEDLLLPPGLSLALGDRQAIIKSNHDQAEYENQLLTTLGRFLNQTVDTASPAILPEEKASGRKSMNRLFILAVVVLVFLGSGLLWRNWSEHRNEQLAQYTAFKEAINADDPMTAYLAGRDLDLELLDTSEFNELWQQVTRPVNLQIDTIGAEVWFRPYLLPDTEWIALGSTPFAEPMDLPKGVIALRVEKPGFDPGLFVVHVAGPVATPADSEGWDVDRIGIVLQPTGVLAQDTVGVPATDMPVWVTGWTRDVFGDNRHAIPAFAVSKYEVSNAEYLAFVDAGAYSERGYWEGLVFEVEQEEIPFEQARDLFVDQTGVAGPANWSLGHYPEGEGDIPVTGISWYEAVAYSRFRGMTLPTVHHWARYALGPWEGDVHLGPAISALSNYDRDGVLPIGADRGLGPWGTYDTGGNVREWVWTRGGGKHLAMGGSWSDYGTDIGNLTLVDGISRNEFTGLRLIQLLGETQIEPELLAPIDLIPVTLFSRKPVSDEAFEVMRYQFSANNRTPLQVEITEIETSDAWILESHNLIFANDSLLRIFVMKPRLRLPVYQAVIYAPHGGAFRPGQTLEDVRDIIGHAEKVVRTGRWVFMPEWYQSIGRYQPYVPDAKPEVIEQRFRRAANSWFQDSADTINYIDSLENIDNDKIAFFSESFGSSVFGPKLLALQPRYKAAILLTAGLENWPVPPWAANANYLPRINQPVLMINGRFDPVFPHETSQKPYFDLLGTPEEYKRHVLYEDGHFNIPENLTSREIANWLDQHLGPVK